MTALFLERRAVPAPPAEGRRFSQSFQEYLIRFSVASIQLTFFESFCPFAAHAFSWKSFNLPWLPESVQASSFSRLGSRRSYASWPYASPSRSRNNIFPPRAGWLPRLRRHPRQSRLPHDEYAPR